MGVSPVYFKKKESMTMKNKTVLNWTQELASKDGKYTGGSAASMVAAVSVSLAQFIFELQVGKKRYQDQQQEIQASIEKARELSEAFLDLSEEDANAFEPVLALYKLPRDSAADKKIRQEKIDEGLVMAAQPPYKMLVKLDEVADLFQQLIDLNLKGTIAGDITVGLDMAIAAIKGARINTMANVQSIQDKKLKAEMTEKVEDRYQKTLNKAKKLKKYSVK